MSSHLHHQLRAQALGRKCPEHMKVCGGPDVFDALPPQQEDIKDAHLAIRPPVSAEDLSEEQLRAALAKKQAGKSPKKSSKRK